MPTLTHLPTQVLGDIIEIGDKNAGVNQYGWYVDGFNYNISSESDCVHSGQYGLEIKPETVDTRGSFWGIHYSPPLTKIKYINFWVKGKKGGEIVFVWVTTDYGAESGFYSDKYVEISASEWRFVKITLSNYSEGTFSFFSFILEQGTGTDSVCIDDVSFTP